MSSNIIVEMYIKELEIVNFRGFSRLTLRPNGHVVIMGEPRSGRSDLIEALGRVLDAESLRTRVTSELDFYNLDTSTPIRIAATLAGLDLEVEQQFFENLEFWDKANEQLLPESLALDALEIDQYELVLRLEYWARWLPSEERCEEWIHYPKASDPDSDYFVRASRRAISELGYGALKWGSQKVLELRPRSTFRRVIADSDGDDFAAALESYVEEVRQAARNFMGSQQVRSAIEEVIDPISAQFGVSMTESSEAIGFEPEGGSTSGLLRSLGPTVDMGDEVGHLPAWRRGSTSMGLLRLAEVMAVARLGKGIYAIDDLGDALDSGSAAHIASAIRKRSGQVWVSTRVASVAEVFEPQEVVRLGRDSGGERFSRQGRLPTSKEERMVMKHWHRDLLPALSYRSVIIVEGPHDFTALHALALRMANDLEHPLLATHGIALINAGSSGDGGYASVLRLSGIAKSLGLRVIGVIDGDVDAGPTTFVNNNQTLADVVVRLPDRVAIEEALLKGVPVHEAKLSLRDASTSIGASYREDLDQLSEAQFIRRASKFMKDHSLHGLYVGSLPVESLPPIAIDVIARSTTAANDDTTGMIQL